ncbi:MAG: transglutaminase-like domain-containing protein [Flavisolibacter sp.]
MNRPTVARGLAVAFLSCLFFNSFSQGDYTNKITEWKKTFPKEDVIATTWKETVDFSINPNPKEGEAKVNASVLNEVTIVPVKDYLKYDDGLFYNDEITIDNFKVTNTDGKDVKAEKVCGDYHDENIFHSDQKVCAVKFTLGERGKAYKYSYQENYHDIKFLTSFYFNRHLPVTERIVQFNIPSWMELDLREFNFAGYGIQKTSTKEGDLTKIVFTLTNALAYVDEPQSPNHAITYPHVVCVNKAFTQNGQRTVLFENVKDLYNWYHFVTSDIGNKPDDLKNKVAELTLNKKTDLEKVESIFYWVQDNIRYIAFENGIMGFKPDAAQNVFKNKYGDCKGKANLLKEMLKVAGYDARLTWIGTSDLPYDYSLPSLCVDNHMICTLILNGKKYFLDGTEEHIALNDYAQRIQGKQVLIEDGKNFILEKIPEFPAQRNKESKTTKMSIADDKLTGSSTIEYNGESKIIVQDIFSSIRKDNKNDALVSWIKNANANVQVTNIKNPDFTDRQKPLLLGFDFNANNQVTKTGNELYVVVDWDKDFGSYEMPDDRKNDYEFDQKYYYTVQTELAIPAGYKVDYLPTAFKKVTTDYSFEGSYTNNGKTIIYKKAIVINKPILKKAEFPAWNAFVTDINKFYNDQVVLTK